MSSTQTLVTYPNGAVVPADTLEVQAARAAHLTGHVLPVAYAHPYPYAHHGLVAHTNGAVVPADTPDVYAAKVAFAAAGAWSGPWATTAWPASWLTPTAPWSPPSPPMLWPPGPSTSPPTPPPKLSR